MIANSFFHNNILNFYITMNKVLIVEASDSDCWLMSGLLSRAGYEPIVVEDMEAAKQEVTKMSPGAVIVSAMKFRGGTAKELINWLKEEGYKFPLLAVVDNLNPTELIDVMCDWGAVNVIQRLAIDKQLVEMVDRYASSENIMFILDNTLIPRKSADFRGIEQSIEKIGATNANVIIFGEIGMGREQVAREIYEHSSRTQKPIIVIEAGGAPHIGKHDPKSDRSETYNRIKGYFTNADGGTIILKNLELLTFDKQSVLLHILETEHPDVRIICTADPHLIQMVTDKEFRANLFYLLRESDIKILPLREVTEDIAGLADFFLTRHAKNNDEPKKHLDASALKALKLHQWPGNIRELRNVIVLAAYHATGDTISDSDITISESSPAPDNSLRLKDPDKDRDRIIEAYRRGGSWTAAAKLLGISERALLEQRKKHGINKKGQVES